MVRIVSMVNIARRYNYVYSVLAWSAVCIGYVLVVLSQACRPTTIRVDWSTYLCCRI